MATRKVTRYDRVKIVKSKKKGKKYDAVFTMTGSNKSKTISFGAAGMSDYTIHKNSARKRNYIGRHKARENWSNPYTAGTLSHYILWNQTSLRASIASYKRRFKLK